MHHDAIVLAKFAIVQMLLFPMRITCSHGIFGCYYAAPSFFLSSAENPDPKQNLGMIMALGLTYFFSFVLVELPL